MGADRLFRWVLVPAVAAIVIGGLATALTVSQHAYSTPPSTPIAQGPTHGFSGERHVLPMAAKPDAQPPHVVETTPRDGAKSVDACAFIRTQFSEEIDPQSISPGSFLLETAVGERVAGGVSASGATAHFTPLSPLTVGVEYKARLNAHVKDKSGRSLANPTEWRFTAGACGTHKALFVAMPNSATGCNDDWKGTRNRPFCTLNKAVNTVQPGDIISVRAGEYAGTNIGRPGTDEAWIRMRAFDNEKVVITGTDQGPSIYFYTDACDEYSSKPCQPVYWVLEGLTIRGSVRGQGDGNAVKIDTPRVKLVRNILCCTTADVVKLVRTANDVELIGNEIYQDPQVVAPGKNAQGIDIVGADRVRVSFNRVHDIPDIGVYAKGNSRDAIFENNRVRQIGVHALMLGQSTDAERLVDGPYETYDGLMRNNVVIDIGWSCLAVSSSFNARAYHNTCYNVGKTMHGAILLSNESEVKQASSWIEIRNNLVVAAGALPLVRITSNAMTDYRLLYMDNNLYAVVGGDKGVHFRCSNCLPRQQPMEEADLRAWRAQLGQDTRTRTADPQFRNTETLKLSAASPARDAAEGALVAEDYLGTARPQDGRADIGAYEFRGESAKEPPVKPAPASAAREVPALRKAKP